MNVLGLFVFGGVDSVIPHPTEFLGLPQYLDCCITEGSRPDNCFQPRRQNWRENFPRGTISCELVSFCELILLDLQDSKYFPTLTFHTSGTSKAGFSGLPETRIMMLCPHLPRW